MVISLVNISVHLKKRNSINKNIKKIIDNNGAVITNQKYILEKIPDFYKTSIEEEMM